MPVSYLPEPDGYLVWRDSQGQYGEPGKYVVLWFNKADVMKGNFQSRSKALNWLYTLLGKRAVIEQQKEASNNAAV